MDDDSPTTLAKPDRVAAALTVGPILLFLAATAYGILEVHAANDTWIGLAAGRQILTADEFPATDTFSYTAHGQVWYNQNWLTHLSQYWLYSRLGPDAVVYATWTLSASIFLLTLLAAYWRSGSWVGSLLAASVVALGCRDFLNPRPATTGFFCLAGLWALLCALEGQRDRRRWWPILLFLPLLLMWGNAHGSFVFGYGVLGLYVGHWFVVRTIRVRHSWSFSLAAPLVVILVSGVLCPHQVELLGQVFVDVVHGLLRALGIAPPEPYALSNRTVLLGVLVTYAVYWGCIRYFRPRLAISDRQVAAMAGIVAAALVLTIVLSPFGIQNFTHGSKVAGSSMFRQVSEWYRPFEAWRSFPPVWRFWTILGVSLGLLLVGSLLWWLGRGKGQPAPPSGQLHSSLFDVAVVLIGLWMTLWARRFAPIYFIFGAPVFLVWIMLLARPLMARPRRYLRLGLTGCAGLFAIAVAIETGRKAHADLVQTFEGRPEFNLLERVTRYDTNSHNAIQFLKENQLEVNLLVDWAQAGLIMLHCPEAKVFMDGRAQQVYNETQYRRYCVLLVARDTPRELMMRILDQHNTDAVLLRRSSKTENLRTALEQSPRWVPVLLSPRDGLFLRRPSRGLTQLGELLRRGQEWRPHALGALVTRGFVWQAIVPPDLEQAIACWEAALRQDVTIGSLCFRPTTAALLELGREQEAHRFVDQYYQRLNQPFSRVPSGLRRRLLETLATCRADIEAATASRPADDADN